MNKHMLDILSVAIIILIAALFLIRVYFKMKKNKCVTMCNGCDRNKCSSRSFAGPTIYKDHQVKLIRK
ncbi:MAG: FeoB-associated Cys-rich membrane protein [Neisseriaceae bacterium]